MPLWAQVLSDLSDRLRAGEFDERFPTDQELVEAYGVSRQTVREAVRRLADDGLLGARARTRHSLSGRSSSSTRREHLKASFNRWRPRGPRRQAWCGSTASITTETQTDRGDATKSPAAPG